MWVTALVDVMGGGDACGVPPKSQQDCHSEETFGSFLAQWAQMNPMWNCKCENLCVPMRLLCG